MRVDQLNLMNFRNYQTLSISFSNNINVFIGSNAQGKTNIIEALYLGAMGKSHRTSEDEDMIRWNEEQSIADIGYSRMGVENRLQFRLTRGRHKEILSNGFPIKPRDVIGSLNAVLFSPEDLWLIKGVPAVRRRFLDVEISQASPTYYRYLIQFQRALTQRNNLLKAIRERKASVELLDSWDEQVATLSSAIVIKRLESIRKLGMLANLMHRKLTENQENLSLTYEISGGEEEAQGQQAWYKNKLLSCRETDIYRGSTTVGPHRDDLVFKINGKDLRNFGSQGQQRTGVLSLKLAELEFLKSETGEYPILLLDDVMSELDAQRREQLLLFIKDRIQTFITATDEALFPLLKAGRYHKIRAGMVVE